MGGARRASGDRDEGRSHAIVPENAAKTRWLVVIGQIITGTPLSLRLVTYPASVSSVGVTLRAESPCNKALFFWRFFQWLTREKLVTVLVLDDHLLDYLQLRADEPCTRNTLKCLTKRPTYMEVYSELVTQTRPVNLPRRAPRPLLRVLEALEETVVSVTVLPFGRVYAWFHLTQACSV